MEPSSTVRRPPKKARLQPSDPTTFGFKLETFVCYMMKECPWITSMTGAYAILYAILEEGERYLVQSQCSLSKALERACIGCTKAFGEGARPKFWKIAKFLTSRISFGGGGDDARMPYVLAPCMAGDVVVDTGENGNSAWILSHERWLATPRRCTRLTPEVEDLKRRMNFQMLECIVQHQLEHADLWTAVPDLNLIFMALTLAKRAQLETFSAPMASHIASIAVRYHMDESRSDSSAFKGLRRWRNVSAQVVIDVTIACIRGQRESPRHHQLWHLERIVNEHRFQANLDEAIFLLLVGTLNDHIFASLPPEDAAEAVLAALIVPHLRSPKNDHDIKRLEEALRKPRSPYLHILFPKSNRIPIEVWVEKLAAPPTRPS